MATDRRSFLQLLGAGAFAGSFTASIKRALAIPAHNHRTGTIADVEHIVILMQENRSFDHYFGTLRGVRGFGDPRAVRLPSGDRSGISRTAPAARAAVPSRRRPNLGPAVPRGLAARLDDHARAPGTAASTTSGCRNKGTTTMALPEPQTTSRFTTRWPTPSPSATPTTARSSGRPIPTATTCGRAGSATTARTAARCSTTPRPATTGRPTPSACSRRHLLEDLSGRRATGLDAAHFWGWDRRRLHRQLRRQLAALLSPVPERAAAAARSSGRPARAPTSR